MALAKILLVEDDEQFAVLVKLFVSRTPGLSVELVKSLDEMREVLGRGLRESGEGVDLILLDLTVPGGVGGVGTVRQVRKETALPVVILSGDSEVYQRSVKEEAKKLGVTDLLWKGSKTLKTDLSEAILRGLGSGGRLKVVEGMRVAQRVQSISIKYAVEVIACMAALSLIGMSTAAFFVDMYEQLSRKHDYVMPGWIALVVVPAVASIVYWLYAKGRGK